MCQYAGFIGRSGLGVALGVTLGVEPRILEQFHARLELGRWREEMTHLQTRLFVYTLARKPSCDPGQRTSLSSVAEWSTLHATSANSRSDPKAGRSSLATVSPSAEAMCSAVGRLRFVVCA